MASKEINKLIRVLIYLNQIEDIKEIRSIKKRIDFQDNSTHLMLNFSGFRDKQYQIKTRIIQESELGIDAMKYEKINFDGVNQDNNNIDPDFEENEIENNEENSILKFEALLKLQNQNKTIISKKIMTREPTNIDQLKSNLRKSELNPYISHLFPIKHTLPQIKQIEIEVGTIFVNNARKINLDLELGDHLKDLYISLEDTSIWHSKICLSKVTNKTDTIENRVILIFMESYLNDRFNSKPKISAKNFTASQEIYIVRYLQAKYYIENLKVIEIKKNNVKSQDIDQTKNQTERFSSGNVQNNETQPSLEKTFQSLQHLTLNLSQITAFLTWNILRINLMDKIIPYL